MRSRTLQFSSALLLDRTHSFSTLFFTIKEMVRVSGTLGFGAALLLSSTPAVKAVCRKYLDAASTAATNLQNTYFVGGTYPQATQWVWISAVDAFYLRQRAFPTPSRYLHLG
jgi:hypothetical protein